MDLLLFSGFLGSGKTTLILALARGTRRAGTADGVRRQRGRRGRRRPGSACATTASTVYEITAGCICCQLGVDLVKTLEQLVEQQHPETVIVEASGVATPDGVLDALSYYRGPAFAGTRSVGVLDPTRLEALIDVMTPLIESQVAGVDELVITKIDEASPHGAAARPRGGGTAQPGGARADRLRSGRRGPSGAGARLGYHEGRVSAAGADA